MAELGQTQDPTELVKGRPDAIEENVRVLRARADRAGRAAEGLKAIDTGAWQGPAAGAFHDKFSYEPGKWYDAADSLLSAADALDYYASTLRWAQAQAVEAIALWNQGQAATRQAQAQHDQATAQAAVNGQRPPAFADPGAAARKRRRTPSTEHAVSSLKLAMPSPERSRTPPAERRRSRVGLMRRAISWPMPGLTW